MAEEKQSKVLLVALFIINTCAFGLAVAAERRRSTGRQVPDEYDDKTYCVYDSDIASGYGVGALVLVLAGQALVMGVTRCLCCGSALAPGGSRACAIILFLCSWLTFSITEACLLAGAVRNAYHTKYRGVFGVDVLSCQTLRKGVFAAGAAFTVFNAILSVFYYITFGKAKANASANAHGWKPYATEPGVAMGSLPN